MANASSAIDLYQPAAAFREGLGQLVALKVNRLARWLPINAPDRVVAQWGNVVDDFMLEAQDVLRLQRNGAGEPEGEVAAEVGTLYLNTEASPTGSRVWVKATGAGTTGWEQLGGALAANSVALDRLVDAAALSVPARASATGGARSDLASGGARRFLASNADNTAIAFRALEAADVPALSGYSRFVARMAPTVLVASTNSATSILGGTLTIPAGTLGTDGQSITGRFHGTNHNQTGNTRGWNYVFLLNGATLAQDAGATFTSQTFRRAWWIDLVITRVNASLCTAKFRLQYGTNGTAPDVGIGQMDQTIVVAQIGTPNGGVAVDWTASQAFDITVTPTESSANLDWITEGGHLEAA